MGPGSLLIGLTIVILGEATLKSALRRDYLYLREDLGLLTIVPNEPTPVKDELIGRAGAARFAFDFFALDFTIVPNDPAPVKDELIGRAGAARFAFNSDLFWAAAGPAASSKAVPATNSVLRVAFPPLPKVHRFFTFDFMRFFDSVIIVLPICSIKLPHRTRYGRLPQPFPAQPPRPPLIGQLGAQQLQLEHHIEQRFPG